MIDNINNISIIYENDAGDLNISSKSLINLVETKKTDGFGKLYEKLVIEFIINDEYNNYESNSLIFHKNKLDRIVINYDGLPNVCYSLPKYIKQEKNCSSFDYDLIDIIPNANGGLRVVLEVNCLLYKDVISITPGEVMIIDENDERKPRYHSISSLTASCLVFKDNGKLKAKKINLKWLDSSYVVKSHRINLTKTDKTYKLIDDKDLLYLNDFFGEEYGDYPQFLEKIQNSMLYDIRKTVANRGCDIACIHCYKYRINKEEDMFNILIEYLCCKANNRI